MEAELESTDMPSVQQIAEGREEHYRYSRMMIDTYPDFLLHGIPRREALRALEQLKKKMDEEGHVDSWIYHGNYVCRIQRNTMGSWCGYVGVPPGHPVHGLEYNAIEEKYRLRVHGGLTFAELVHNWGKDRMYFLGFDCGHAFDVSFVNIVMPLHYPDTTYKDKNYVVAETNNLARQLELIEIGKESESETETETEI